MEEINWKKLWNAKNGSIYQSWEWAEINRLKGREPIFIGIEEDGELKAGILCFLIDIKTLLGSRKMLFSEGTPLALNEKYLGELLTKFKEESRIHFYGFIRPSFFDAEKTAFIKNGFHEVKNATISIELNSSVEELFKNLEKKSARWGIKKAEKEGVRIYREHLKRDLDEFYEIYKKTAEEQFSPEPFAFFENISVLELNKLAKLFVAKKENRVIGGALLLMDNRYGVVSLTSISEEGMNLQAMNLLYWEMIKYCKENDKKLIDLGGYMPDAKPGSKMENINRFKENFGGQVVEQPSFTTSKKYVWMFNLVKKFNFLKRLYKKEK